MGDRRILVLCSFCIVWCGSIIGTTYGQIGARNTVPETISSCYRNSTAYNRYTRQPMHIDNLIAIIRKIEKRDPQWDMRRIARTLIHRYMFDGIEFNNNAKPEFQYNPKPQESVKTEIVKSLIQIPVEDMLPSGVLDNDEMCALHWMLSHSMNATVRDEELVGNNPLYPGGGYNGNNPGTGYNSPGTGYNNPGTGYNSGGGSGYNSNNNGYNSNSGYRRNRRDLFSTEILEENNEKVVVSAEDAVYTDSDETPSEVGDYQSEEATDIQLKNKTGSQEEGVKSEETTSDVKNETLPDQVPTAKETVEESQSEEKPSVPVLKGRFIPDDVALDLPSDSDSSKDDDAPGSPKFARQVSQNVPGMTRRPIETGVIYTKWGSISAGRMIAGIAAALEPMTIPVGGGGSPYIPQTYGNGAFNPGYGSGSGAQPGVPGASNPFGGSGASNPFGGAGASNPFGGSGALNPNPYGNTANNPYGSSGGSSNYNPNPSYSSKNQWGRRKKRQTSITFQALQSIYGVTLAGDVGQAAILNGQFQLSNVAPPRGIWNDTTCPREYVLEPHPLASQEIFQDSASWSYLTEAEIRGGMDGIILGSNIGRWDPSRTLKLSELLSMYYSESGIVGDPAFRSCNRGSLFSGSSDATALREQSRSFAYLFNNKTNEVDPSTIINEPNTFYRMVDEAYSRMSAVAGNVASIDPICTRQQSVASSTVDTDDNMKFTELKSRIYAVLDHTATYVEIDIQKRFLAQMSQEINVSPRGARLGVVDGNSGMVLISPNYTDNNAVLACNILALPTQTKLQDIPRVLTSIKGELQKLREEEERTNNTAAADAGIIVLFMVQGKKLEDGQKAEINRLLREIDAEYGDTQIIFTSSKYQKGDFDGFLLNPEQDFIRIQGVQNISDFAGEFSQALRKSSHARLTYAQCNANRYAQEEEHKVATTFFLTPGTIQYYKISPDYFYSSKNLRLRFTSDNGKIRVCQSRGDRFPNSRNNGQNGVHCKETTGTYVAPGSSQIDVEYSYSKPCGKNGDRSGCVPIYYSFTPISYPPAGSVGLDCAIEGCQSSNQVKVTFTHWDMRCNSGFRSIVSLPMALITTLISLLMWKSST